MNKSNLTVLTLSLQNKGHGTFPRHERMAKSLKKKGFNVIWISPDGYKNKLFDKIKLVCNFVPNFLFFGIYLKLFITCLLNYKKISKVDYVLAIREYDAIALFFNPFFLNSKKILFSRGDVVSILRINLHDQKILRQLKDRLIILIYPVIQRILLKRLDLIIFQAEFLRKLFRDRIKDYNFKSQILPNDCINIKKKIFKKKKNKKISIGFAAPMYWSCKGLDVVVKLYKELIKKNVDFKLLIAGDGPHSLRLIKNLNDISKFRFKWFGWVKKIDLFFDKIDLLIIPSKYDSCPNLLLEAIDKNKILFTSNIPAHKEILKNQEFLFSLNSISKLTHKITKIQKSINHQKELNRKIYFIKKRNCFDWDKKFVEIVCKC